MKPTLSGAQTAAIPSDSGIEIYLRSINMLTVSKYPGVPHDGEGHYLHSDRLFAGGQLEIYALFKWAGYWLDATANKPDVDFSGLGDSLTLGKGLLFSVLLLGIPPPVAMQQQGWVDNAQLSVELESLGIKKTPIAEIGNYFICMMPLFLGFASNLTSWASKLGK